MAHSVLRASQEYPEIFPSIRDAVEEGLRDKVFVIHSV